jgi:hypothetical protein
VTKKFQVALYHQHVMKLNIHSGSLPPATTQPESRDQNRARRHPELLVKKSLFTNHLTAIT